MTTTDAPAPSMPSTTPTVDAQRQGTDRRLLRMQPRLLLSVFGFLTLFFGNLLCSAVTVTGVNALVQLVTYSLVVR